MPMEKSKALITVVILYTFHGACIGLETFSLNGPGWMIQDVPSEDFTVMNATVPGTVHTALLNDGKIDDPYYRFNDKSLQWVAQKDWKYMRNVDVPASIKASRFVTWHIKGVDTFSDVFVNGQKLANTSNMFHEHLIPITDALNNGSQPDVILIMLKSAVKEATSLASKLTYKIPPDCSYQNFTGFCHPNLVRKEQSSFGWDWGPAFAPIGIWREMYLLAYNSSTMHEVKVYTKLSGISWNVYVSVKFLPSSGAIRGQLVISNPILNVNERNDVNLESSNMPYETVVFIDKTEAVNMWWPNGAGDQPMYDFAISFISTEGDSRTINKRVGFRSVELIQEPIPGSSGLSFYFAINGRAVFAKGSNWIPADAFQERIDKGKIAQLLLSAKLANMNMLRVWGGGIYESDEFYSLADEFGIMLWHDFMFACGMYPASPSFLDSVSQEVDHQIYRLAHHPSIITWSGNNENEKALRQNWYGTASNFELYKKDYVKLYVDTIRKRVVAADSSRPFVSSSPSNGNLTIQQGWVAQDPTSERYGDIHFYDYLSDSWSAETYKVPRMATEYGLQSWPSFETLRKVSINEDWNLNSEFVNHRQHHADGQSQLMKELQSHFTIPTFKLEQDNFEEFLFLTQVHQAMGIRRETEHYRSYQSILTPDGRGHTMAALYWQLNDIWQAPSWSSIEFGGKWKMLHYYARNFLQDVIIAPRIERGNLVIVYVQDSLPVPERPLLTLNVTLHTWDVIHPYYTWSKNLNTSPNIAGGFSEMIFNRSLNDLFKEGNCTQPPHCFFTMNLTPWQGYTIDNWIPVTYFNQPTGLVTYNSLKILEVTGIDEHSFTIILTTEFPAPFVWLEAVGIPGYFSDNGFLMVTPRKSIGFYSWAPSDTNTIQESLRVRFLSRPDPSAV